jgi:ATP-dependent Lhr-like helicase
MEAILSGANVLLVAPTGSGKTEACILPVLSAFLDGRTASGIAILYITPLRALNRDMMERMVYWGEKLAVRVETRHGDTSTQQRRRQSLKPPDMLITTPETLQAILPGSRMQRHLRAVRWVIIDEVHGLAESKRGTQLALALERLREVTGQDFQRVGLSATIGSPQAVAQFLAGSDRAVRVIEVPLSKDYRFFVERPMAGEEDHEAAQRLYTSPEAAARMLRVKELVDTHSSTLVFVNSRQNAEMLGLRFNLLDDAIAVHHGSLSREARHRVEDAFKRGKLTGIVCTSTLELGIDVGSVDLAVQYMSPRQVSTFIQRVGRSGHRVDRLSEGVIVTVNNDDSLEALAIVQLAKAGRLEPTRLHEKALDVLAHQLVGLVVDSGCIREDAAYRIVTRAYPYRDLSRDEFTDVARFLDVLGTVYREAGHLTKGRGTRRYYYENLSMIPDERVYPVVDMTTDRRVGILGEEFMVLNAHVGLNFILRGFVWKIERIGEEEVYVTPVEDPTAAIPGWDGELLPVPYEIAQAVGQLRRELAGTVTEADVNTVVEGLVRGHPIERYPVRKIVEEIADQVKRGIPVAGDETILIEGYDRYVVVHACFGEATNRAFGYILDQVLSATRLVRGWWVDGYRLMIELTSQVTPPLLADLAERLTTLTPMQGGHLFNTYVQERFPFSYTLKFVAERFGAYPRGRLLNLERLVAQPLKYADTPIYRETLREVKSGKVDLEHVTTVLNAIRDQKLRVATHFSAEAPTAFAYRILNRFAEIPEMMAPETVEKDSISRMRTAIGYSTVELFCLGCGDWGAEYQVKQLPERPACPQCGSQLLAALRFPNEHAKTCVRKRLRGTVLTEAEVDELAKVRRNADVVLSYGRRGVIAQQVHGVGPQTASRLLARMHRSDEDLYRDLLEAKIKYVQTRQYWGDR